MPDEIQEYVKEVRLGKDEVIKEMDSYARDTGFPTMDPAVGGWLSQIVRLTGAERIFEFGSGYGYTAYWFAKALPDDGEIILTEFEEENLDKAKELFKKGVLEEKAVFNQGDALEIIEDFEGPFDIVLIDMKKPDYPEAFRKVADKVPEGGVIIADDLMTAGRHEVDDLIDFEALRKVFIEDKELEDLDITDLARENMPGIIEYLEIMDEHPRYENTILPLGEGVMLSTKTRDPE